MQKRLFIFDLDGVLFDSKENHFSFLNSVLEQIDEKYVISEEDQRTTFEGKTTRQKLKILTELRGLPEEYHDGVWSEKQKISIDMCYNLKEDLELIDLFKFIKSKGVIIAVASNSVNNTVNMALRKLGIFDLVDHYMSNEHVIHPKPDPEIYIALMRHFKVSSKETTIFEDSVVGKSAAASSGARLVSIGSRSDVTMDLIKKEMDPEYKQINILIPMAGEGSRFKQAGYDVIKPLINVDGKSMINLVHDNIGIDGHYIFIAKKNDIETYRLNEHISSFCKNFTIIEQDGRLDGATLSALLATNIIDNDSPLLIANSDQHVDFYSKDIFNYFVESGIDGLIFKFNSNKDKWSYSKENEHGIVLEVAEKKVISDNATCGIYMWRQGKMFVKYAKQMIEKDIRVNNEFYVCPVYNEAIQDGLIIKSEKVKSMHSLGTPEDLELYLSHDKDFYNIEGVTHFTERNILLKLKNAKYDIVDYNTIQIRDSEDSVLESYNEDPGRWGYTNPVPVVDGFLPEVSNKYNGKNVYVITSTLRFYHIFIEILLRLVYLKTIDKDFKLIILGNSNARKNKDGIFMDMLEWEEKKEVDLVYLYFWLKKLDIDFECMDIRDIKNNFFEYESSYMFYERSQEFILEKYDCLEKVSFIKPPFMHEDKKYFQSIAYYSSRIENDSEVFLESKKYLCDILDPETPINRENKNIYISRGKYNRVHKNEKDIERYYNSLGYETIYLEDFSPIDQIKICREAENIVAYLGSSLLNVLFANEDCRVEVLSLSEPKDPNFILNMSFYYSEMLYAANVNHNMITIPEEMDSSDVHSILSKLSRNSK